jgi:hypothetical protein
MSTSPFKFRNQYGFSIALLIIYGCAGQNPWKAEAALLLQESARLEEQHLQLNARIDSLWDATTAILADALPADFPPVDRDIFLHSRNADHIRMFMTFKTLPAEVQSTVDAAGKYDEMLATQVRALQTQRTIFERQKIQFLIKVAETDQDASKDYAGQFAR